jgi:hypothetical protein
MPYDIRQWPATVYPDEVAKECPEAKEIIDVLLRTMGQTGPQPSGYSFKTLGKKMGGLWQINLKFERRQVRILYAPYGMTIVLFRIHKKGSPQEQQRAYELAKRRKAEYEHAKGKIQNGGNRTLH